ncbi:MAG: MFS transporter [Myxococcota bacterium]
MVDTHVEESLGANPGDAALNPADQVAMGVPASKAPGFLGSSRGRAFRALAHRPYRLLFSAFLVNQTGFWLSHLGMQGLMAAKSGNDPLWLGWLFFALFIPAFALAPLAGVTADRYDRKRIMLVSYAGIAALSAVLAALTATDAITPLSLLSIGFGMGLCFCFSGPASYALAANTVPPEDMPSAVSLQSAANNLTRVVGPMAVAPIIATGRFEWAFMAFVVAATIAGGLTAAMRVRPYTPEPSEGGILARLAGGFRHASERKPAVPALSVVAVLSLFGVSHAVVLPVFAEEVLGNLDAFAWIVVSTGAGAVLGALTIGYRRSDPTLASSVWVMLAYSGALAAFAVSTSLWAALLTQFVLGWCYFAIMTSLQTLVQQLVDESKRGRVMSLFQVAWAGLVPWGGLALGAAAGSFGVVPTLLAGAAVCAVYAIGIGLWSRQSAWAGLPASQEGVY